VYGDGSTNANLPAWEGCRCADAFKPVFAFNGDGTSGSCVGSCAKGKHLCYGRAQSSGLVFCANTAVLDQDSVADCAPLDADTILQADFARDTFLKS